ncbi:MAG: hypothetical protein EPGJADBJ_00425 [Saprospiraceae bacterium]|nr:hypothetical protein [Saprospiraceae bacterium]
MTYETKSLAQLDKKLQPSKEIDFPSRLIVRHNALLTKPIGDYTVEDLRLMIGQNTGLEYLIPRAMEILGKDVFAEGDFYPGDLLENVLCADPKIWNAHPRLAQALLNLLEEKMNDLLNLDVTDEIIEGILAAYEKFKTRNRDSRMPA